MVSVTGVTGVTGYIEEGPKPRRKTRKAEQPSSVSPPGLPGLPGLLTFLTVRTFLTFLLPYHTNHRTRSVLYSYLVVLALSITSIVLKLPHPHLFASPLGEITKRHSYYSDSFSHRYKAILSKHFLNENG